MKAWRINTVDQPYSTVVFAETRGKAKSIALSCDACEDAQYTDILARRFPKADNQYREGKCEMDWNDSSDRIFLVKECGWQCTPDFAGEECDYCPAADYCDYYNDIYKDGDRR